MVSGALKIKVKQLHVSFQKQKDLKDSTVNLHFHVGGKQLHSTPPLTLDQETLSLDESINLDLNNVEKNQNLSIELYKDTKPVVQSKVTLGPYLEESKTGSKVEFANGAGYLILDTEFHSNNNKDSKKKGGQGSSTAKSTPAKAGQEISASVPHSLSTSSEGSKLWFLHSQFYYTKTKEVYSFAKTFSAVGFVARYGEATLEYLVHRFSPKSSLSEVDESLSPVLTKVDSKVDENVYYILKFLTDGQDYVLSKKNGVVHRVNDTVGATKSTVSNTVAAAQAKAGQVTVAAIDSAYHVKDSTLETISSVTNYTYSTLANATNHILAYVPRLNKKTTA